jgi:hypothetical protein
MGGYFWLVKSNLVELDLCDGLEGYFSQTSKELSAFLTVGA